MKDEKLRADFLPMSETAYYILLSLARETHGYAVMQNVEKLTSGRIRLGAGTLYGTLQKLEREKLIESAGEVERRKLYRLTAAGRTLLRLELQRLVELVENGAKELEALS